MKHENEKTWKTIEHVSSAIVRGVNRYFRRIIPKEQTYNSFYMPKSTVILFIIAIILLSFALKYPAGGSEGGIDSFVHHSTAQSIVDNGYIHSSRSILSMFGMYPLSLNGGVHVLMASFSSITSSNIFYLMTPFSFIQSIVAILGMFIAAREFKKDVRFALLVSFIYTCTTRFTLYTNHQVGTRGLFLTIVPFFLWALFHFLDDRNTKNFAFVLLFAFITFVAHRMGLYILMMVFFLSIALVLHKLILPIVWSNRNKNLLFNIFLAVTVVAIILFTFVFLDILPIHRVWERTPEDFIIGDGFVSYIVALAYNYAKYVGIFSVFIPLGFILLLFKDKRNIKETVLLLIIIPFFFIVGGFLYLAPVMFGFFSFFIGYSIIFIMDRTKRKKLVKVMVFLMMIIALIFPNAILYRDIDGRYPYWMGEDSIEAGIYLSNSEYSGIGDYVYTRRIDVFTTEAYGYRLERGYGSIERFDFSTVKLRSIRSLIQTPHEPFTIDDWYWGTTGRIWRIKNWIYNSSVVDPLVRDWVDAHNIRHYIVNSNFERISLRLTEEQVYERILGHSVVHHRYRMYTNSDLSIYWI